MAFWIAKHTVPMLWKRVPWSVVWATAVWLAEKGRERAKANLTHKERDELLRLIKKSKGLPGNLEQRDRTRLKNIAGKAIRG